MGGVYRTSPMPSDVELRFPGPLTRPELSPLHAAREGQKDPLRRERAAELAVRHLSLLGGDGIEHNTLEPSGIVTEVSVVGGSR